MKTILVQLDTDPHPSVFDRVVAVDTGVDEIFSYGDVSVDNVTGLVHGGMFTRGPQDLKSTAFFVGGSDVNRGTELFQKIVRTFFGPIRCSVMVDSNGSNTTAAAAVLSAGQHVKLNGARALVLGATGPVGWRAVQLLAGENTTVGVVSRSVDRAAKVCDAVLPQHPDATLTPLTADNAEFFQALAEADIVIAAGAAGVELLSQDQWKSAERLQVLIDLNAVPPAGIAGIEVTDKAVERDGKICYGAIGVGGLKMKIHKASLEKLFSANDQLLDTNAIYAVGQSLLAK